MSGSRFLSVIIPSYNQVDGLRRLISWLRRQSLSKERSEIIIINDGSSDGTREFLDALRDSWIPILHQENQGQAKARSKGVAMAKGDILLFLDDDMEPGNEDFLSRHLHFHEGVDAPTVALGPLFPQRERCWRPAFVHFYERAIAELHLAFRQGHALPSGTHFFSSNVSLPKDLYLRSGGFSPKYWQAEDRELGLRLEYEHEARFAFLDEAFAFHHPHARNYSSFIKRAYLYGRYDLKIAKSYPEHDELSPYQIFAKPPLTKMMVAKFTWTMPGLMSLFNSPLIQFTRLTHRLGLLKLAMRCCSILYCINFVLGLKDEHNYEI